MCMLAGFLFFLQCLPVLFCDMFLYFTCACVLEAGGLLLRYGCLAFFVLWCRFSALQVVYLSRCFVDTCFFYRSVVVIACFSLLLRFFVGFGRLFDFLVVGRCCFTCVCRFFLCFLGFLLHANLFMYFGTLFISGRECSLF